MADGMLPTLLALGFALGAVMASLALWTLGRRFAQSYRQNVLEQTRAGLSEMFIFMEARQLTRVSLAVMLLVTLALLLLTGNPLLAGLAAAACLLGPRLVHKRLTVKRRKAMIRQLPDTLDSLVGALRSGLSLQQALGLLADQLPLPSRQEFGLVVRELRMGVPMDEVLEGLERRVRSQEYTMFTTCMRIAREVGGNLTESLERLSETMRRKLTMEDKIDALTSQGKMQGWIVGSLPLLLMWVLSEMEPEAMEPLFNTWYGYAVLGVIAMLLLAGFVLIRKIVTIDV